VGFDEQIPDTVKGVRFKMEPLVSKISKVEGDEGGDLKRVPDDKNDHSLAQKGSL
jgi:hypothetical protein